LFQSFNFGIALSVGLAFSFTFFLVGVISILNIFAPLRMLGIVDELVSLGIVHKRVGQFLALLDEFRIQSPLGALAYMT
jgi:hypothetical protein